MTRRPNDTRADRVTRRRFLQTSSSLAAAVYVTDWTSPAYSAPKSPNEKLNIAVVGVAGRGGANLGGVSGENIVALCDVDDNNLTKAGLIHPGAKKYNDFRKMLEQSDIEAVVVSTPDHCHATIAATALRLGKPVYCEKPLAHSLHEARVLTQLAAETKLPTQMGNQLHSAGGYRRTVEATWSGLLGNVREAHCWSNRPVWPQGIGRPTDTPPVPANIHWDLWLGPAPQRPYHPAYMPFKWRGWWDFGTGALGDMGCHILDPAVWALKLGAPTSVEAKSEGATSETPPKWAVIRYEFPARDTQPPVTLTWWDGGKLPPADLAPGTKIPSNGVLLIGDKATLLCEHGGVPQLIVDGKASAAPEPAVKLPETKGHHADWILACKGGPAASSNFSYAGPLTEVVLLGNLAIRAGKKIEWNSAEQKVVGNAEVDPFIRREYRAGYTL